MIDMILKKSGFSFGSENTYILSGGFPVPNAALIIRSTCSHDYGDATQCDPVRSLDRVSLAILSRGPTLRFVFSELPDDQFDQRLIRLVLLAPVLKSRAHSNSQIFSIR
jgi:hypothetical protein